MTARTRLIIHRGWEGQALRSTAAKRLVMRHTASLTAEAIKQAPRRGRAGRTSWNSVKNNIEAFVQNGPDGWYGNVVIERNPRVRHAMLLERGFTDTAGRRHPGRRYLKAALLKKRID